MVRQQMHAAEVVLAWASSKHVPRVQHPSTVSGDRRDSAAVRKGSKTGRSRGRQIYLGGYDSEFNASKAYDRASIGELRDN